jgi:hypothetical protein
MPLLEYLDRTPAAYRLVAWLTYGILLAYVTWPLLGRSRGPRWLRSNGIFGVLLGLALLAFRWPVFFYDGELNIDESFFIMAARRLAEHGWFWKDVNGTTSGPLNFYPLLILKLLGFEITYGGIRLIGLGLVFGTIFFQYLACARLFGRTAARLGLLPLTSFFAFSSYCEFVHYSSEHVAICLFSLCAYLASGIIAGPSPWISLRRFGVGVVAGMMPFTKLQALPLGLGFVALMAVYALARDRDQGRSETWRSVGQLLAGFASFPLLVLACVLAIGATGDFVTIYILSNVVYSGARLLSPWELLGSFGSFTGRTPGFNSYCYGGMLLVTYCAGSTGRSWKTAGRLGGVLALTAVALFVVVFPGRPTYHYLLFLAAAFGLLIAIAFGTAWSAPAGGTAAVSRRNRIPPIVLLALAGLLPQVIDCLATPNPILGALTGTQTVAPGKQFSINPRQHPTPTAQAIAQVAKKGETVVQWGMMVKAFIEADMRLGTRDVDSYWEINDSPLRDYFRERYLADIKQSNPVVFFEAVGPDCREFHDRATQGYATFPQLKAYIDHHYTRVAQGDSIQIFLRNDRFASLSRPR